MIYRVRKVTYSVTLGTCYNRLMLSRESKTYHLTLSKYKSIIASESKNITIPPQFGVVLDLMRMPVAQKS